MLPVSSLLKTCLSEYGANLESNVFHQGVDGVSMLLPYLSLVSFVHYSAFAYLARFCLCIESILISFDLWAMSEAFNSFIQAALPLCHLIRSLCQNLCTLS